VLERRVGKESRGVPKPTGEVDGEEVDGSGARLRARERGVGGSQRRVGSTEVVANACRVTA
jgi:hypothetical protein